MEYAVLIMSVCFLYMVVMYFRQRNLAQSYWKDLYNIKHCEDFRLFLGGPMDGKEVLCGSKRVIVPMRCGRSRNFGRCLYEQDAENNMVYNEAESDTLVDAEPLKAEFHP